MTAHLLGSLKDGVLELTTTKENVYAQYVAIQEELAAPQLLLVLVAAKKPRHYASLRTLHIALTKELLRRSIRPDDHLINAVALSEDLGRSCAQLTKRLRDWYALVVPELSPTISDHRLFAEQVATMPPKVLMEKLGLDKTMGKTDDDAMISHIQTSAAALTRLYTLEHELEQTIEQIMKTLCPNVLTLAGPSIGSKLLREAGSLRQLAAMRASTIQLLGAERALFRHLRNKSVRPPKHGLIINHPLVTKSREKGKAARAVADKLAIASKVDYFKGEFIADKLLADLERRL